MGKHDAELTAVTKDGQKHGRVRTVDGPDREMLATELSRVVNAFMSEVDGAEAWGSLTYDPHQQLHFTTKPPGRALERCSPRRYWARPPRSR